MYGNRNVLRLTNYRSFFSNNNTIQQIAENCKLFVFITNIHWFLPIEKFANHKISILFYLETMWHGDVTWIFESRTVTWILWHYLITKKRKTIKTTQSQLGLVRKDKINPYFLYSTINFVLLKWKEYKYFEKKAKKKQNKKIHSTYYV